MKKKFLLNNIVFVMLVIILLVILIIYLTGHRMFYVKTGSMEPEIPQWSLVISKNYKDKDEFYNNVSIGTDITFKTESGNIVTHRIIFIDSMNDIITTQGIKGDAAIDKSISYNQVLGVVTIAIPLLGYVIMLIQTWYFWIMLACVIAVFAIVKSLIKEIKKK